MPTDRTHHVEVKSLFRADGFIAFRDACDDSDVSRSRMLCKLAEWWVAWRNLNKGYAAVELPDPSQVTAIFSAFRGGTPFPQLV